jgi:hypothetical protein
MTPSRSSPAAPARESPGRPAVARSGASIQEAVWGLARAHPSLAFAALLVLYLVVQLATRVVLSDSVMLDEAEQLLFSQSFAWGYGPQPPLYTWLQKCVLDAFGISIFSLALLKHLLLLATYGFTFLSARLVLGDARLALLAACSFWVIPQVAWEALRDHTHTVLATSLSAATLYLLLRLHDAGATRHYLALGLLVGLGALSKYSFLVFAAALFAAALTLRTFRSRLLDGRSAIAVALGAVVVLPHVLWVLAHADLATARTLQKLRFDGGTTSVSRLMTGLLSLARAAVSFLTPLWVVLLLTFPRAWTARATDTGERQAYRQLLERVVLFVAGILALSVVAFGVTRFRTRWMTPLLSFVPTYFFLRIQRTRVDPSRLQVYGRLLALCAVLVAPVRLGEAWLAPRFGMQSRLHFSATELARQIRAAGFHRGTIVAEDGWIGGNLRLFFEGSKILTPALFDLQPGPPGPHLVVWHASRHDEVPPRLWRLVAERLPRSRSDPLPHVQTTPRPPRHGRAGRLAFIVLSQALTPALAPVAGGEVAVQQPPAPRSAVSRRDLVSTSPLPVAGSAPPPARPGRQRAAP